MPISEEIADIDIRFQFRFFLAGQRAFVRFGVEFANAGGIRFRKVERQDPFDQARSIVGGSPCLTASGGGIAQAAILLLHEHGRELK